MIHFKNFISKLFIKDYDKTIFCNTGFDYSKNKNPSMLDLQYKFLELLSHFELCIHVLQIKYQYLQTGSYFGQIKKQTEIVS